MQFLLILLLCTRRLFNSCLALSSISLSRSAKDADADIAVVGCGVLGTSLCRQILKSRDFNGRTVTGITKSTARHDTIRDAVGDHEDRLNLMTYDEIQKQGKSFRDVVFCAPPSGFDDYPGAVKEVAATVFDRGDGTMVFTSAGSVYGGLDGEIVNEKSPLTDTDRAKRLLEAEAACLEQGGVVLRLAGLYTLERGAHNYWLTSGKDVAGREDGIINLLHYDDAAGACAMALTQKKTTKEGVIYLISDGHPLTRRQICESAQQATHYADQKIPKFLGTDKDSKGKVYDGSWSNRALNWTPKYSSFDSFMSAQQS